MFEYMTSQRQEDLDVKELNKLSGEGWELVGIRTFSRLRSRFYFKRQLLDNAAEAKDLCVCMTGSQTCEKFDGGKCRL